MNFYDVIQNIATFAIGTGILGWVAKSIFTSWLSNKSEKYKSELYKATELYKAELERLTREHEIRYSKLHADRADTIKELYVKLTRMEQSMRDLYKPVILRGEPQKDEKVRIAVETYKPFISYFQDNRLFFDKQICEIIDKIGAHIVEAWNDYMTYDLYLEKLSAELEFQQEQREVMKKCWNVIKDDVPKLKMELEDEFRKLLGVIS